VENIDSKIKEIQNRMKEIDKPVYYAAIDRFGDSTGEYLYSLEDIEPELKQTAAVISPEDIAELFTPRIPVETTSSSNEITVKDTVGLGFRMSVRSSDDVEHRVNATLPSNAAADLKNNSVNSRRELGKLDGNNFTATYTVLENGDIKYGEREEPYSSFRDTVKSLFHSSVSPALAKSVNRSY
jgi:hypothetical protein